jgi:hypothetical protein
LTDGVRQKILTASSDVTTARKRGRRMTRTGDSGRTRRLGDRSLALLMYGVFKC